MHELFAHHLFAFKARDFTCLVVPLIHQALLVEVEIDWECNNDKEYDRLQELVDAASIMITDEIRDKLRDLKRDLYNAFEEATSFEAYQTMMSEVNNLRYTELGEIIPPDLIKDATVVDGVQLQIPGLLEDMGMEEIELPDLDTDSDTDTLDEDELYSRDMSKDRQTYI